MRTMKNTYCVEVAFLNTDSDDIKENKKREGLQPLFLNSKEY